jgi:hypothetical protein
MPSPLESMRIVARRLQPLEMPFAFVGGAVMWVLVDGRRAIVEDMTACPKLVRSFIANSFASLLESPDFHDAFPGYLSAMTGARERAPLILQEFRQIARLP